MHFIVFSIKISVENFLFLRSKSNRENVLSTSVRVLLTRKFFMNAMEILIATVTKSAAFMVVIDDVFTLRWQVMMYSQ